MADLAELDALAEQLAQSYPGARLEDIDAEALVRQLGGQYVGYQLRQHSRIKSAKDLRGKRIATEVVNLTKKYLRKHNVKAEVEFSWGATEVKAHELVDAIVEITETGASLRANKLRIVDTLLVSTPRLIANLDSWKNSWKRRKISARKANRHRTKNCSTGWRPNSCG